MNGLSNRQESALARVINAQDSLPMDFTSLGITKELIALRECRMIEMSTDMGHELAFVRRALPEGLTHYQMVREQRKKFINLRDSADELIGLLVADCDRDVCEIAPRYYEDHENGCRYHQEHVL